MSAAVRTGVFADSRQPTHVAVGMKLRSVPSSVVSTAAGAMLLAAGALSANAQQDDCQPVMVKGAVHLNSTCEAEPPAFRLLAIAGRARVQPNERALIGGFIIGGELPVRVIIRGVGTSLEDGDEPLNGRLLNPALELRGDSGELIAENDDWRTSPQEAQIRGTGIPPREDKEAAIIATLQPGAYTAVLRGSGDTEGIGVVEIYDLRSSEGVLSNLASRAFVSTGDNVLIGGLIVHGGPAKRVLVRAIGSSLAATLPDALVDPTIEVIDQDGATVGENDDWRKGSNTAELEATGTAPTHEKESAVVMQLRAGLYTATVRGKNNGTGTGVVEIYRLE